MVSIEAQPVSWHLAICPRAPSSDHCPTMPPILGAKTIMKTKIFLALTREEATFRSLADRDDAFDTKPGPTLRLASAYSFDLPNAYPPRGSQCLDRIRVRRTCPLPRDGSAEHRAPRAPQAPRICRRD